MQGKKDYQEELFVGFQLSEHVPKENFYRRLKSILNLDHLYSLTKSYYGDCGQKSVDVVVFYKLCLIGYLENIISDRALIAHCKMRMDILFFLGYNIDEALPWHSTLSRTRNIFPEDLFIKVFEDVLKQCIDGGLVSGHTQVVDSAPIKANASMDSLELKVPKEQLEDYLQHVRYQSTGDRKKKPRRKAKENKASKDQQTITASDKELKGVIAQQKNWTKKQDQRPGGKTKTSKYTSNKTHYSPTDPDARISVKTGKARKLNYLSQLSVDPATHIITHIAADYADQKDSRCLPRIVETLQPRMRRMGLVWSNLLADAGYSSGSNYDMLENQGLQSFIPPHGTYKGGPEGFTYVKEGDYWHCPEKKKVVFRKVKVDSLGVKKRMYATRRRDCKGCPIAQKCIGKSHERQISVTYYKEHYERAIKRIKTPLGRKMKNLRQSVVEPVFGILTQFMGMRKINTKGIKNANKQMLMAATAYNLKKLLKHKRTSPKSIAQNMGLSFSQLKGLSKAVLKPFNTLFYPSII